MIEVKAALDAIRELYQRQQRGEITEDECRDLSLPFAGAIADAKEAEDAKGAAFLRSLSEFAESNPRAVQAAVAGLIHALGHYARSGVNDGD